MTTKLKNWILKFLLSSLIKPYNINTDKNMGLLFAKDIKMLTILKSDVFQ